MLHLLVCKRVAEYLVRMSRRWNILVALALTLSLALSAFAHRPMASAVGDLASNLSGDWAQYVLPDGSLPDLCVAAGGDGEGKSAAGSICEFCRLAAAIVLPQAPQISLLRMQGVDCSGPARTAEIASPWNFSPGAPPQGPPAFTA